MRYLFLCCVLICAVVRSTGAHAEELHGHELLRRVRSPLDLARRCMPSRYLVPVELRGSLADEIATSLVSRGLEPPRFEEIMTKPGVFSLYIANESYSLDTRETLSGILNPLDFVEAVLRSVLRYRDESMFERMVRETRAIVQPVTQWGPAARRVCLRPVGEKFGYTYDDRGAVVTEGWLTKLEAIVDTSDYLIHSLILQRCQRTYDIHDTNAREVDESTVRYEFAYLTVGGHVMPSELHLYLNDTLTVTLTASYRIENRYVVFDKRVICSYDRDGKERMSLEMRYGSYRFDLPGKRFRSTGMQAEKTVHDIHKAAKLAQKASAELRAGAISSAFRIFEKLAREYPSTPQGIEAKKLLEGVPKGL